jgi:hypothetical protein
MMTVWPIKYLDFCYLQILQIKRPVGFSVEIWEWITLYGLTSYDPPPILLDDIFACKTCLFIYVFNGYKQRLLSHNGLTDHVSAAKIFPQSADSWADISLKPKYSLSDHQFLVLFLAPVAGLPEIVM